MFCFIRLGNLLATAHIDPTFEALSSVLKRISNIDYEHAYGATAEGDLSGYDVGSEVDDC